MQYKNLSSTEFLVSAIGLGASPLSHATNNRPSEEASIEIVHQALDAGINFIDVADVYVVEEADGKHDNEILVAKAIATYKFPQNNVLRSVKDVIIATKGGLLKPTSADISNQQDPLFVKSIIKESFEALGGVEPISIWLAHAYDENYKLEAHFGILKEAVEEGLVKHVGVSNFSIEQIEKAKSLMPIVLVQNELNLWHRKPIFDGVLDYCEKHSLLFLPWSPVGGGSGYKKLLRIKQLENLAVAKECTIFSLILAWLRHLSTQMIPVSGVSKVSSLQETIASLSVVLSADEMKQISDVAASLSK